jgi:acyl-[acyl-carrier-protein] desaturase
LSGLNEAGEMAREKILAVPARLERIAEAMKSRTRAKTFSFDVAFAHEFTMD